MDYLIIFLTIILGFVIGLYFWGVQQKKFFKDNGIPFVPFNVPVIGNMWEFITAKKHLMDIVKDSYDSFADKRFYGTYQFNRPLLIIRDLELIRSITIKDFDHFQDHMTFVDEKQDEMFGNGLLQMRGQKWKDMRATLSPAFTSSKMRHMFNFVLECAKNTSNHLLKEMEKPENRDNGYVDIEMKDLATRFTNDAIASSTFGIEVNSFSEPNNLFYKMGRKMTTLNALINLKFFFMSVAPKLTKFLGLSFLSKDSSDFFRDLVTETMKQREETNVIRPDMIHLLNQAKKGTLKHDTSTKDEDAGFATVEESTVGKAVVKREWTHIELVAQATLFFFAGFETSSTLICFMGHELAIHPDIQKRLQEEIDEVASRNDGNLRYEDIQHMKYMDMVTSETLRFWPPGVALDRKCVKPYKLPPADDNTDFQFTIPAESVIQIPLHAIHHDPKYYPDPEIYDPERFSDENKGNIKPFSYLPFGVGPRNCIGSRFALMEVKAMIFYLLLNFDIITTPKTTVPLELVRTTFNFTPKKGFQLGLKPRKVAN